MDNLESLNPFTDLPHILVMPRHWKLEMIDVVCMDGSANYSWSNCKEHYEDSGPSIELHYMAGLIYTATTRGNIQYEPFQLLK